MIDKFTQIKETLSIIDVMAANGVPLNRGNQAVCPFHEEKSPSLTAYPDTNSFYCFGCGAGGSVIDFIARLHNLDPLQAAQKLDDDFNLDLFVQEVSQEEKRQARLQRMERERDKKLVAMLEQWADNAFDILCRCFWQLVDDTEKYAPKTFDELDKLHPRFVTACHLKDYAGYLLDALYEADFEEKLLFYLELESEVKQLANYTREGTVNKESPKPRTA